MAPPDGKAPPAKPPEARAFGAWETGILGVQGSVVVIFDRGKNDEAAFACHPRTARELGRSLIALARRAEQASSRGRAN